jgi:hypothetical protein
VRPARYNMLKRRATPSHGALLSLRRLFAVSGDPARCQAIDSHAGHLLAQERQPRLHVEEGSRVVLVVEERCHIGRRAVLYQRVGVGDR